MSLGGLLPGVVRPFIETKDQLAFDRNQGFHAKHQPFHRKVRQKRETQAKRKGKDCSYDLIFPPCHVSTGKISQTFPWNGEC